MTAFYYLAANTNGEKSKGYLEADSAKIARARLRQQGLFPLKIEEISQKKNNRLTKTPQSASSTIRLKRIGGGALVMSTRQLATLLQAQLNIEDSLTALIEQSETIRVQQIFAALRSEVRSGYSLSNAIGLFPHIFPDIYRATINAGEESGQLPKVIQRLADYMEQRQDLLQKIRAAFAYPIIVSIVALVVIVLLFVFVMPQIIQVFDSTKQELPMITRLMMAASYFLREYGWLLLMVGAVAWFLFRRVLRLKSIRYAYDTWLLRLPILGKLMLAADSVRMANTLAILVGSGVPLLTSIRAATDNLVYLPLKQAMENIHSEVREGHSFSKALESSHCFPPVITYLVKSGETTGDIAGMLDRAAAQQQRELEGRLNMLTTILGPLLIVIMGLVVGVIVLSVLLPIAEINQLVR